MDDALAPDLRVVPRRRSRRPARWSTDARTDRDAPRAQDRRRHAARHPRGRAESGRRCCSKHGVGATFLFSLGPDHTGRAIRRVFRRGFVGKVRRTSVVKHYGVQHAALRHGAARPRHRPPRGGRDARGARRRLRDRRPHLGPHPLAGRRSPMPTRRGPRDEMRRACERYHEIFGEHPRVHGAAGWQMNRHALRLTQRLGFDYCSDGRGTASPPAGVGRRAGPLPAVADHAAHAGRADRHRRRSPRKTSPRTCSS